MTTPTHALTEQTVHVPEPPACSYDRDHADAPPPATGIAYLAEPCMCGPTFYVCPGHWAELTQYDLEEPGYCDTCMWDPVIVVRIDPL